MKNKNVNFVDKYIEKVVVGIAAVFFLVVVWMYGLGSPYKAKIGNTEMTPEQVEAQVRAKAAELKKAVNSTTSPLPDMTVPKYPEDFRNRMDQPLVDLRDPLLALSWGGLGDEIGIKVDAPQKKVYLVATVPAPEDVVARGSNAVLLDEQTLRDQYAEVAYQDAYQEAVANLPPEDPDKPLDVQKFDEQVQEATEKRLAKIVSDIQAMVGQTKPADFVYSSVQADFDLSAWINAMRKTPEENRLPEDWWADRIMVTGVILERQTLDPATGEWGPVEEIQPPPGSIHFNQTPKYRPEEAGEVIKRISLSQEWILRPPFVPSYPQWLPPDVVVPRLKLEDAKRHSELQKEVNELDTKIKRLQTQLQRFGVNIVPGTTAPRGARPYGPGVDPRAFEGPNFNEGPGPAPTQPRTSPRQPAPKVDATQRAAEAKTRQIEKLQKDLSDLEAQRAEKIAEMDAILYAEPAVPGAPGTTPGTTPGTVPGTVPGRTTNPRGAPPPPGEVPPGFEGEEILRDAARDPAVAARLRDQRMREQQAARTLTPGRYAPTPRNPRGAPGGEVAEAKIRVYAHDLTAQRGKTYRYRMRVNLYNPLYKRGDLVPEQVEQNKDLFVLASDPSPWSAPVTFEKGTMWFLTEASPRQKQATVEIYHVFDGERRKDTFAVNPGDPIGGKRVLNYSGGQIEVDLSTGAIMTDVTESKEGIGSAKVGVVIEVDGKLVVMNPATAKDDPTRMRLELELKRLEGDTTAAIPPGAGSNIRGPRP